MVRSVVPILVVHLFGRYQSTLLIESPRARLPHSSTELAKHTETPFTADRVSF